MYSFSIIIPVFNEEGNIEILIDEIVNVIDKKKYNYEIVVVDDCSQDNTKKNILKCLSIYPEFIRIYENSKNYGQSQSIKNGVEKSKYQNILTIDGDRQNNPKDITRLLKVYFSDENIKLVSGIRHNRKDNLIKKISSRVANTVRKIILKDDCDDSACGLKIFDKDTFNKIPYFDGFHRFFPSLFLIYGNKNQYINVDHRYRVSGQSKYGTTKRLFKGLKDMIFVYKLRKNA